jgi:hypothetical protein
MADQRMPSALKQGSVVIAPIVPDAGRIKPRPAILLTPTPLVRSEPQLELIGVTGSYYPDDPLYFELPWTPDGRGPTRFARPSAAKMTLVQRFPKAKIWATDGYLPKQVLEKLLIRLKEYADSLKGNPP